MIIITLRILKAFRNDIFLVIVFSLSITIVIAQTFPLDKYKGSLQKINILDKNDLEQTKKYLTQNLKLFPEDSLVINYLLALVYHFEDRFKESQDLLDDLNINSPEFEGVKSKTNGLSAVNNLYLGNLLIAKKNVDGNDDYIKIQNFINSINLKGELSSIKYDSLQMLILHIENFRNPHAEKKLTDFVMNNHNINCRLIKSMLLNESDSTFLILNEAISFYPKKAEYYYQKGIFCNRLVKFKEYAISSFDSAINLDGNQAKYFYERAKYCHYFFECENARELQDINRAIFLDPGNIEYYSLRYSIHERNDKFKEALQDINTLIKLDPDSKLSYISGRAILNYKLDNIIEYNSDYKLIFESKDTSTLIHFLKDKGIYLRYIKKYDLAILDFKYALELNKLISKDKIDLHNFNYLISDCYNKLNNYSLALVYCEKSNDQNSYYKANLLIKLNRNVDALEIINEEILKDPSHSSYYELRSICKLNLGDKQGAFIDIQYAIDLAEIDGPWLFSQRALLYHEFKMYDLEIEDLTTALNITKNQRILKDDENYETKLVEYYKRRGKANLALNLKVRACYDFSDALNYNVNNLEVLELIKSNCK